MRTLLAALTLALVALPASAAAHDLRIERAGDGFTIRSGHPGGEALPIDAAKVKAIRCGGPAGAPRDVRAAATFARAEVTVAARCAAISVLNDAGTWSLTPDGEKNLPPSRVKDAIRSWESRRYAKWVDAASAAARAPLGDELELVPVSDLAGARVGDEVAVRVLLAGRPAAGARVELDDRPAGETDGDGVLRLRLRRKGAQSVETSVSRPLATAEAESLVLEASLAFEVAR